MIEGNQPADDNDWEVVKKGGDRAIRSWIDDQLHGRSCTAILVGTDTGGRKWINYGIVKSWNDEKGVVGIHIHGLKDRGGRVSTKSKNPFSAIDYGRAREKLSSVGECYDPVEGNSRERYAWIKEHLARVVEEAISVRNRQFKYLVAGRLKLP